MKTRLLLTALLLLAGTTFLLNGCVETSALSEDSNRWVSLPVREGMCPAEAWDVTINSVITKGYMVETTHRDNKFLPTMWFYETYNDEVLRSRVTVKIYGTREALSVRIYPECQGVIGRCADLPRLYDLIEELTSRLR